LEDVGFIYDIAPTTTAVQRDTINVYSVYVITEQHVKVLAIYDQSQNMF
jgi:hypothetical protein